MAAGAVACFRDGLVQCHDAATPVATTTADQPSTRGSIDHALPASENYDCQRTSAFWCSPTQGRAAGHRQALPTSENSAESSRGIFGIVRSLRTSRPPGPQLGPHQESGASRLPGARRQLTAILKPPIGKRQYRLAEVRSSVFWNLGEITLSFPVPGHSRYGVLPPSFHVFHRARVRFVTRLDDFVQMVVLGLDHVVCGISVMREIARSA
jgi:hypothetical protein